MTDAQNVFNTRLPNTMNLKNEEGVNKRIVAITILGRLWDLKMDTQDDKL